MQCSMCQRIKHTINYKNTNNISRISVCFVVSKENYTCSSAVSSREVFVNFKMKSSLSKNIALRNLKFFCLLFRIFMLYFGKKYFHLEILVHPCLG